MRCPDTAWQTRQTREQYSKQVTQSSPAGFAVPDVAHVLALGRDHANQGRDGVEPHHPHRQHQEEKLEDDGRNVREKHLLVSVSCKTGRTAAVDINTNFEKYPHEYAKDIDQAIAYVSHVPVCFERIRRLRRWLTSKHVFEHVPQMFQCTAGQGNQEDTNSSVLQNFCVQTLDLNDG